MLELADKLHKEGNALFSQGKYLEAINLYKECLKKSKDDKSRQEIIYRNLAQCYINLQKYKEAVKAATEGNIFFTKRQDLSS